jgi:PKD repeat protein
VCFTDLSAGDPPVTSWDWDFGDGDTSTEQHPCHTYNEAGTYAVSLTAANACGSDNETKVDYVTVSPVVLSLGNYAVYPGDPVPVCVDLSCAAGLMGYDITVTFSEPPLTAVEVTPGPLTPGDWSFTPQILPGEVRVICFGFAPIESGSGCLFYISLDTTAAEPCTSEALHFAAYALSDSVGAPIIPVANDGQIDFLGDTPVADFSAVPQSGCVPLEVCFTDESANSPTSWLWDFGDGSPPSAEQNPCHTYQNPGPYTVSLTATNNCGEDTETKSGYITVAEPPVACFTGAPTSGCAPLEVCFTDCSTGDPTSWEWDFGDGETDAEQNPCHTYQTPGVYAVTLTVSNVCDSDIEEKLDYITVLGPPTAGFSGTPQSGCRPLEVCFTDESTGDPTSWEWDFGDGTATSTEQNPCHTYQDSGSYTVTLTASNACGSDAEVKTDYITVLAPPTAAFSGTPPSGEVPLPVEVCFTDESTGDPTSWEWDFGDGSPTSTEQDPCHEYQGAGSYDVTLTVTNPCGSDAVTIRFTYEPENYTPVLSAGDVDPDSGINTTTFTYTVHYYDEDGDAPADKNVFVDGVAHAMALQSGDASDGTYQYQTTGADLGPGSHKYFFSFADGQGGSARLPATASSSGPTVDFEDVPPDHWAHDEVIACVDAGIVGGYFDGLYHPEIEVTREQMAVFIARALAGGDDNVPDGPATATFDDVPTDHWAYKYVEYCVAQGVVEGFDPGTYAPLVLVNREQMAVFIARAVAGGDANVPDGPATATFGDVPTDHWAFKYVEYCVAQGVVEGFDPVTYAPLVLVNREQMAVFIARAFDLLP